LQDLQEDSPVRSVQRLDLLALLGRRQIRAQTLLSLDPAHVAAQRSGGTPISHVTCTIGRPLSITTRAPRSSSSGGYFRGRAITTERSSPEARGRNPRYLKAGREVAVDGRLVFDEFQTQDGGYAARVYIVASRVEFLATRQSPNGQASDEAPPDKPAGDGAARGAHQSA
jgi:hypothetical protein